LIYKKILILSARARRETTVGELVNLIQVNAESFVYVTNDFNMLWSAPLQITISLVILWSYLGAASLAGFASIIIFAPFVAFFYRKINKHQFTKLSFQDARIK
jgi:hypothetical protein